MIEKSVEGSPSFLQIICIDIILSHLVFNCSFQPFSYPVLEKIHDHLAFRVFIVLCFCHESFQVVRYLSLNLVRTDSF